MVSGASGIDHCLLVIAADEGIMPQTREHLQIIRMLGIRGGIIVLNKCDLVDAAAIDRVSRDVRAIAADTPLRDAPVLPLSAKTGRGIDQLKAAIAHAAANAGDRARGDIFRLYIDRIFSVSGFGTVVTGSVLGGSIRRDANVYLLPGGSELRVRRIERYGKPVDEVMAGDRASLNLAGLDREDFQRGMLIADRQLTASNLLDARIELFAHARPIELWSQAIFLIGTYEAQARIHLIDHASLAGGAFALAQIHLPGPCAAQPGDRFVLRSSSSDITLGGGEIIDPSPLHHRRRTQRLIETMGRIAEGDRTELIAFEVRKSHTALSHQQIAEALNLSPQDVIGRLQTPMQDIVIYRSAHDLYAVDQSVDGAYRKTICERIAAYHRDHPLEESGVSPDELQSAAGMARSPASDAFMRQFLESLEKAGTIKRVKHTWALVSHSVQAPPTLAAHIAFVDSWLLGCGMQTPLMADLANAARAHGINEKTLKQVLPYLVQTKRAYQVEGAYIHASIVDSCRIKLIDALKAKPAGITVAGFRDLVQGNRKICLNLLAIYDAEGSTERRGDVRVMGRGKPA
jgi:selenocysteine-specific elongation factor